MFASGLQSVLLVVAHDSSIVFVLDSVIKLQPHSKRFFLRHQTGVFENFFKRYVVVERDFGDFVVKVQLDLIANRTLGVA